MNKNANVAPMANDAGLTASPINAEPFALTIRAAAAYSGFSRTRLFELLKAGQLESRMDGAKRLILTSSLKAAVLALPRDISKAA